MSVVHTADRVPVGERAEYWRHVIGETLVPLEPIELPDRIVAGAVGALRVGEMSARRAGGAVRGEAHIRRADPDLYKIDVLAAGRGAIEQGSRQAALEPGDFALVDLSRPARWHMDSARIVAVLFPPALLPLSRDEVARLTALRIRGDRGAGALVSSLARQLVSHLDDWDGASGARFGTAIVDLLAAGLAARLDRGERVPERARKGALLARIRAFIEERLADPALSPGEIAAAHHISLRYLHRLFEEEQATVAGWIRRRRLERCRGDLLDPARTGEPVAAIGMRWGFRDPAHFNRRFRAAYGVPPGEYRRRRGA